MVEAIEPWPRGVHGLLAPTRSSSRQAGKREAFDAVTRIRAARRAPRGGAAREREIIRIPEKARRASTRSQAKRCTPGASIPTGSPAKAPKVSGVPRQGREATRSGG